MIRGLMRHALTTRRGRLALLWLGAMCLLGVISLFAFSPNQRASAWDSSFLPPGAYEGRGVVRSIVAGSMTEGSRVVVDLRALATESARYPAMIDADHLTQLRSEIDQLAGETIDRPAAETLLLKYCADLGTKHPLGTDALGQDVLARLVHGARTALLVGFVAAGVAAVLGILIGMAMGLGGPLVESVLMRITEVVMSVPLLYVLVLAAGLLPRSTIVVMVIIGCLSWHGAARYVRAECKKLRHADFVEAARASGSARTRVALRHILPNAAAPVIVDTSFGAAGAILVEATLSFLGLGAGDAVSWGSLVKDATGGGAGFNWWLGVFPGAMMFATALSLVVLGELLRDALDPRSRATSASPWTYTAKA